MSNIEPSAMTPSDPRADSAIRALELVDRLLDQAGYTKDSSARHNLAIGISCIRDLRRDGRIAE